MRRFYGKLCTMGRLVPTVIKVLLFLHSWLQRGCVLKEICFPATKKKKKMNQSLRFCSSWSFKHLLWKTIFKNQTKGSHGHFDTTTNYVMYDKRGSHVTCAAKNTGHGMYVWNYAHLLSCQHVSMCTCLNYSWRDLVTLVACSTVRMFHRLLCKILRFVCLLCLRTIKTQGQAIGTTLFTCRGRDSREMKQRMSGEQMFPHATSPQKGTY